MTGDAVAKIYGTKEADNDLSRSPVERRIIVVGIVRNELGQYLICKMPKGRGVFPDQWGLPGGGIEEGEQMEAALRRELMEELGIEVLDIEPLFFSDGQYKKSFAIGESREIYMIFLIFACRVTTSDLTLSPEFIDYTWVDRDSLPGYRLNSATVETFRKAACSTHHRETGFPDQF